MEDSSRNYRNKSMEKSEIVDVSSKVMLASIIIMFLIIVLVVILHFYAKWYWRRRTGNQGTRRLLFVFTPSLERNIGIRRGLAASVIKALPIVTVGANEFEDGLECSVCLCVVEEGEKARVLPDCNHGFHVDCIDMWFQSHSTCPLCRNPVSSQEAPSVAITAENNNSNGLSIGNQTRVSIRDSGPEQEEEEEETCLPSLRPDRALIIDIPGQGFSVSPTNTPSSPVSTRFKSLCKFLSREKRLVPNSPTSTDIEQGGKAEGSSKMAEELNI